MLTFPRAHLISQAVGDSAVIVSRDQESELMSSLKVPCKNPNGDSHNVPKCPNLHLEVNSVRIGITLPDDIVCCVV